MEPEPDWEDEYRDDDQDWGHDPREEMDGYFTPCEAPGGVCEYGCPFWAGDSLCTLEIEDQARLYEEFAEHIQEEQECPVCKQALTLYEVEAKELFTWGPGEFGEYPLLGLEVWGPADAPKGIIHAEGSVYHIWIGTPELKDQKLVKLGCVFREQEPSIPKKTGRPTLSEEDVELIPF